MKLKHTFFLLLAASPLLLAAKDVPFATVPKMPPRQVKIDGVLSPGEWDKALKLSFQKPISLNGVPDTKEEKKTDLYLYCDSQYLYGGAVCYNENIPSLMKDADGWFKQFPWFQPRLEFFFGSEEGDNVQLIMTFLGKTYKNFLEPFYCKVRHGKDRYFVEFAIPAKILIRSKLSPDVVRAALYRGSVSGPVIANRYFGWNSVGWKGTLQNPEFWGMM